MAQVLTVPKWYDGFPLLLADMPGPPVSVLFFLWMNSLSRMTPVSPPISSASKPYPLLHVNLTHKSPETPSLSSLFLLA
jgi:hypothetical protein